MFLPQLCCASDVGEGEAMCAPPVFISPGPPMSVSRVSRGRDRGAAIINLQRADVFVFLTAGPLGGGATDTEPGAQ